MSYDSPIVITLFVSAAGTGGILVTWIKLRYGRADRVSTAYIDGHDKANDEATRRYERDIAGIRASFEKELAEQRDEHSRDIRELRRAMSRLQSAVIELVGLIPPDNIQQAMRIVARLNLEPPPDSPE